MISAVGARLEAVHITELRDDVYYAELRFSGGVAVSARPSDAIALALRAEVEILGSDAVLDAAGIEIPDEQEDEVEKFREFLDTISPEDFASGSLISCGLFPPSTSSRGLIRRRVALTGRCSATYRLSR